MVEAATKQHPTVNLDEFERRLRGPMPSARESEDPLAELARLVNGEGARPPADPFKAMFAASTALRPPAAPDPDVLHAAAGATITRLPVAGWDRKQPVFTSTPEHGDAEHPDNFHLNEQQAIFEREMRALQATALRDAPPHAHSGTGEHAEYAGRAQDDTAPQSQDHHAMSGHDDASAHEVSHLATGEAFQGQPDAASRAWPQPPEIARQARAQSRRPAMIMGAIACVGLSLIGGTFALRANGVSGTRAVALIKANEEPVKIVPKSPGGSVVANQDASILDKVSGTKISADVVATTKVATKDEQPIDLAQAPKPARPAALAGQAVTIAVAPPASLQPAPLQPAPSAGAIFGEPKKVKTVQVRPDGSLISANANVVPAFGTQAGATSAAVPGTPMARPTLASLPIATPKTPPATPATTIAALATATAAPATATAAPATATPAPAPATPAPATASAVPAKPVVKAVVPKATVRAIPIAKAEAKAEPKPEPKQDAAAVADPNAPLQLGPAGKSSKAAKIRLADASATPVGARRDATPSSGGFAVQLGASPKEADARDMSSRAGKQYASALDGHQPSVRAGEKDGSPIYRVRVGNLSREDATALCTKLKASGGSCFVAGN